MRAALHPGPWPFDPWVESWPADQPAPDLGQALVALAGEAGLVALDSSGGQPAHFDLLALDPLERLEGCSDWRELPTLESRLAAAPWLPGEFQGGHLLALSYDSGSAAAGVRAPDGEPALERLPAVVGGLYSDWLCWHRSLGLLTLTWNRARPDWQARRQRVLGRLRAWAQARRPEARVSAPVRQVDPAEHQRRVRSLIEEIRAGEVYQANLAHAFVAEASGDPLALYLALRRANPAPYGAYLEFPGGALLSSSPELLLSFDGRLARTRPIKGTAPRFAEKEPDRRSAEELRSSIKDLAELTMIVDLARNDLGQISRPGSVRVPGFPLLESYQSVHHLVAEVVGEPRPSMDARALLGALFPGASITGAPKLAAMTNIARLERRGRGFFCGALGFIDRRGRLRLCILIRTLVWQESAQDKARVEFLVGGGITIRSDPAAEDAETLHKAEALLAALEHCRP